MHKYISYLSELNALLEKYKWGRGVISKKDIHYHLNGGASASLRTLVSKSKLRQSGAFFTGEKLGEKVVKSIAQNGSPNSAAWDPTCGAGDLLLRWSENLDISSDLLCTLENWGELLYGQDIHPLFIEVAKRRLVLAALGRGASLKKGNLANYENILPNIHKKNLLKGNVEVPKESVILMNPPFTMISTPEDCRAWSSGNVAFAAVAVFRCLSAASTGQKISAILPDVLRSGTRYKYWRSIISSFLVNVKIEIIGKFSEHADIDVFVLSGEVGRSVNEIVHWYESSDENNTVTLGSLCEIRVGTIVPHRHNHIGQELAYLTAGDATPWSEIKKIEQKINHSGTFLIGPVLAVRRTSSPSDKTRLVTTILNTKQKLVLENHLISIRPYDSKISTCREIMNWLGSDEIRRWIDNRIRCRHLTVEVIKNIPFHQ